MARQYTIVTDYGGAICFNSTSPTRTFEAYGVTVSDVSITSSAVTWSGNAAFSARYGSIVAWAGVSAFAPAALVAGVADWSGSGDFAPAYAAQQVGFFGISALWFGGAIQLSAFSEYTFSMLGAASFTAQVSGGVDWSGTATFVAARGSFASWSGQGDFVVPFPQALWSGRRRRE